MAAVQILYCPFVQHTASPHIEQKYPLLRSRTLIQCSPPLYLRISQLLTSTWAAFYYFHILLRQWICSIPSSIFRSQLSFISILFFSAGNLHQGLGRDFSYTLVKALPPWFHFSGFSAFIPWAILLASACLPHIAVREQGKSACVWVLRGRRERKGLAWDSYPTFHGKLIF